MQVSKETMEINGVQNKLLGPGGGTQQLHHKNI